ncbi:MULTISPECIES: endonuclease MutS2 [unclassified Leptolyngbya]|uniref:endonuclease MutS2 n=1 Tax=unclassified Leptolyngbya TaxID=2650499 RepID=UPI0018F019D7|nr:MULTISPECIES: endonuclease MutS2 [unclassified Leptolyngbya]
MSQGYSIQTETLDLLEWSRLCQHVATFAATKLGAIALRNLRIPETLAESQNLLEQTKEAYLLENRLPGGLKFDGIEDIGEALERARLQGVLSGAELLAIATTLAGTRALRRVLDDQENIPALQALLEDLRTYPELEQEIYRCIDDRGKVTDRASPKLGGIREQLRQQRDRIYDKLQNILQRHHNAVQDTLITQRGDRFVLPVKSTHKDVIPGIVHDVSTSGATLYVEPQSIVSWGNHLRQLLRQEQVEEEAVRRVLTEQVAEVVDDLEVLLAIATTLDLATARARYSLWLGANPPRFVEFGAVQPNPSGESVQNAAESVVLRQLRHPLLIWQHQHEHGTAVVPIDLTIRPTIRVVAITGPNTGGKTVTLKTFGLAALMAKVGLFIPAREPVEIPWFSHILADIGDEQSLQQSLSTFSGHIRRICRILNDIQPSDPSTSQPLTPLVLLDEVGAGTDPTEGSALAIALLRHLANHASLTIATTHYGELKALKYQDERFENASVEFDDVSLSPTYRLLWGIPGRSNALAIAGRLGLSNDIISAAQEEAGVEAAQDVNQVIAGLEQQRRQQEEKNQAAADLMKQTERLYAEVSRKAETLKLREEELKQQQEAAVQEAIAQARREIARVIRDLQRGPATAQDAQQATDAISGVAERRLPSRQKPAKPKPGFRPKEGDRVRIPRLGQTAEVLSNPDADGNLTVRFGIMKMNVSLADIESLQGEKPEVPAKKPVEPKPAEVRAKARKEAEEAETETRAQAPAVRTSRNTLDLRGSRVADAEVELERAIASAQPGPLWIIHGHGTGKLRQGVHEFLKQHPQIARFEPAAQADGGSGVTVAYVE